MNKIILNKPLKINGQEIKELTYDTGEITVDQFCEAEARKTTVIGNKIGATARELDNAFHLYIGFMAIIAVNQHIDVADLERIKGFDLIKIANIGRIFTTAGGGTDSGQSTSGDTSEATPEPLTPALEKSEKAD